MRLLACSLLGWCCPCFRAVCHCWKFACVVDLSLQAWSIVTLEYVAVLGECRPSGRDTSLNLLALVFIAGVVSLSHVDVVFNVLDLIVGYHNHLCLRLVHLQTLIVTLIG